jgi:hypothetical protein
MGSRSVGILLSWTRIEYLGSFEGGVTFDDASKGENRENCDSIISGLPTRRWGKEVGFSASLHGSRFTVRREGEGELDGTVLYVVLAPNPQLRELCFRVLVDFPSHHSPRSTLYDLPLPTCGVRLERFGCRGFHQSRVSTSHGRNERSDQSFLREI